MPLVRASLLAAAAAAADEPWHQALYCPPVEDLDGYVRPAPGPALHAEHPRLRSLGGVEQVKLIGGPADAVGVAWASDSDSDGFVEACEATAPEAEDCAGAAGGVRVVKATRKDYSGHNALDKTRAFPGSLPAEDPCNESVLDYKDANCFYESPSLFFAVLDRLQCGGKHLWRVGGETGWRAFTAPPCVGQPIYFGVVADLGQTNYSLDTMNKMKEQWLAGGMHSILFPGDLSYADGYHPRWDTFGRLAEPLFANVPTSYTVGNHELQFEAFTPFERRYPHNFLAELSDSRSNFHYSYNAGLAHVIMLCSYCDFREGSHQHKWLMKDLAKFSRATTPWLVAAWHTPWYTSNKHHDAKEGAQMRAALEGLLHDAGVDIVLNGHVHAYERTLPVFDMEVNNCSGAVHITIGDGGNKECFAGEDSAPGHPWNLYNWSASRKFTFGHGRLRLRNATHGQWQFFANDDYPKATDEAWLVRGEARAAACAGSAAGLVV